MDPTLIKWLTINFPSEVVTPILLLLMFLVSLWPKIWNIILNQREWNKVVYWERQRLELIKLTYEIEALKKSNNLEEITNYPADPEFQNLLHRKMSAMAPQQEVLPYTKGTQISLYILAALLAITVAITIFKYFVL